MCLRHILKQFSCKVLQLYTVITAKLFGSMKLLKSECQVEDAVLLSKICLRLPSYCIVQNAGSPAFSRTDRSFFRGVLDSSLCRQKVPKIQENTETSSKARMILQPFYFCGMISISLDRLNFLQNLLVALLTVNGTSLKWFLKEVSAVS